MAHISYRWMNQDEVVRVGEIDRTERIRTGYEIRDDHLYELDVEWDTPEFIAEGEGEHTVSEQIRFCHDHISRGGKMIGAFEDDLLIGIGVMQPEILVGIAQIAYLQVSNGKRRKGIGTHLTQEMVNFARGKGAKKVYVSATPSGSAVGFYLSLGFRPVDTPIQELFELEPNDIHMMKELES